MKKTVIAIIICISWITHAAGDPTAGQKKSIVCGACHGVDGNSSNPEWPHLAGQHARYLSKQLHDFMQGKTRPSAIMTPLVASLSTEDMDDLAAFYAQKTLIISPSAIRLKERGKQIYRNGDMSQHITACITCHGPDGKGNEQAGFPSVAGQQPAYIIQQLNAFKQKQRQNDINGIMRDISKRMSDDDIESVAYFMKNLP